MSFCKRIFKTGMLSTTVALLIVLALSGCAIFKKRVAPYDRALLAKPAMNFIDKPSQETAMQHMYNAREGSTGGFGGAGGGCGCN